MILFLGLCEIWRGRHVESAWILDANFLQVLVLDAGVSDQIRMPDESTT